MYKNLFLVSIMFMVSKYCPAINRELNPKKYILIFPSLEHDIFMLTPILCHIINI